MMEKSELVELSKIMTEKLALLFVWRGQGELQDIRAQQQQLNEFISEIMSKNS